MLSRSVCMSKLTWDTSGNAKPEEYTLKNPYSSGFIMIYTVTVSLFDLSPDCRKHQAIGGVPIPQEFHLSVVRPHCLRRFSRSDCDWSGVSLSSARVIAMTGATRSSQLSAAALRAEFIPDA